MDDGDFWIRFILVCDRQPEMGQVSFLQFRTFCDLMEYSLPGSSVHGILQVRILEWGAMPSSRRSSQLASLMSPAMAGGFLTSSATWNVMCFNIWFPKREKRKMKSEQKALAF